MPPRPVPWDALTTLFLDVGNTLISIDFDWVAREIAERGYVASGEALRRAEAAARPAISARLAVRRAGGAGSTEEEDFFVAYLRGVLEGVPTLAPAGREGLRALAEALRPVLSVPGQADRLWRALMPGVPEALEAFRTLGLDLVVVSNADGSVERGLAAAGIRHHFSHVLDSALVGYEKPDPRIFAHALERSGARPETTLHVGDLFHADVTGARSAGVHAALLDPFGDWADVPDVDCEVVPDLAGLVERLRAHR